MQPPSIELLVGAYSQLSEGKTLWGGVQKCCGSLVRFQIGTQIKTGKIRIFWDKKEAEIGLPCKKYFLVLPFKL
jgi:hypothetical protein